MQSFELTFPGGNAARREAHAGVVGSGDLEVLVFPDAIDGVTVRIRTSVDGFDVVWRNVLDRFFARYPLAGTVEINDFGATPGVVSIRLLQAYDRATGSAADAAPGHEAAS